MAQVKYTALVGGCLLVLLLPAQAATAAIPASKRVVTGIKKLQRTAKRLPRAERASTARTAKRALSLARQGRICPLRAALLNLPRDPQILGPPLGRIDRALFKDKRIRRCGAATLDAVTAKTVTGASIVNDGAPFDTPAKPSPANKEEDEEVAELPAGPEYGADPSAHAPADSGADTPADTSGGPLRGFASLKTDPLSSLKQALGQPASAQRDALGDPLDPVVASSGDVVVIGGNTYLSFSSDGGRNFSFIKPTSLFPDNPDGGLCCDFQVAYAKSIDAFLLLEQYWCPVTTKCKGKGSHNRYRLAWAKPSDLVAGAGVKGWKEWTDIGSLTPRWFDKPDLAVGSKYAYLTWDVLKGYDDPKDNKQKSFNTGASFARIPLSTLKPDGVKNTQFTFEVATTKAGGAPVLAQSPTTTGYAFRPLSDSELAFMKWPDSSKKITTKSVSHARLGTKDCKVGGFAQFCVGSPDGDGTMDFFTLSGAARESSKRIWVAVATGRGKSGGSKSGEQDEDRPNSRLLVINPTTDKVVESSSLGAKGCTAGFTRLTANTNGEVAASYMLSCADNFPNFRFALLTGTQRFAGIKSSVRGAKRIGDYSGIGPEPDGKHFVAAANNLVATGYDVTFARFGRKSDPIPPAPPPLPPPPTPIIPGATPAPDLVVSALSDGSITVTNQGTAAAPITSATVTKASSPLRMVTIGPLASGASDTQSFPPFPCTVGAQLRGTADSSSVVAESDETNNIRTFTCP